LLEESKRSLTVENWNRNSPAVPAEEVPVNQLIGDAAAIQILSDSVGKICMEPPGQIHEIAILVCHADRVGRCNKLVKEGKVASRGNYSAQRQNQFNDPIEDRIDFFTFIAFVDRDGMDEQVASSQHADRGFGRHLRCLHRLRAGRKIVKHNR